ncbi:energy-coupling factor ABC transporter ATP-binding protein [Vibrio aestuarianus]|uniref:energy-coupling factor ABC transporter ATP-binding protein n=1 Tax=Vibrio aestuarianus TaxID=28171 RepID=UPI00237CC9F0|nr:energy-coupling factor ABC transporter ATP-binding protein [Vibrio aestuarianus]MDE1237302.1 energy-coupling factor ABC transporter ATP-binding protein [Vibrio aestuarianus]MDE1349487.1 energy-coupling factor ABC transporter ATP-binding protein [Vibrio aestuarianus]
MTVNITAQQLSMRFKDRVLFHIPTLSIGPNDAIYLKGDNGVGKTTLLKILSGLLKPTTGYLNNPSSRWYQYFGFRQSQKDVIYLHQSPYLFDGTVFQNVVYGIRYQSISAKHKRAEVITALRMVGLETLADEHISVLSGGEKQRVAMARAWILKPSILLMDEPSASLDQESIERLVIMAKDLLKRGASLVITSHQTNALTNLCHKQWWIKETTLIESPLLHLIKEDTQESVYVTSHSN